MVKEFRDEGGPEMVALTPGEFTMGSSAAEREREVVPDEIGRSEEPAHKVKIGYRFAVSKYPITRAEFAEFVAATQRPDPPFVWCLVEHLAPNTMTGRTYAREQVKGASWRNPGYRQDNDQHPVAATRYADAKDYADWLAKKTGRPYRLLSEAEWEYACRAGTTTTRFWGDSRDGAEQYANVPDLTYAEEFGFSKHPTRVFQCRTGFATTSPVGSFKPNAFGLYDMMGNVGFWCEDLWHDNYVGAPTDGSAWMAGSDESKRVLRNGHWNGFPWWIRSAQRSGLPANENLAMQGIRVALTLD